jgi:hypothetical protein
MIWIKPGIISQGLKIKIVINKLRQKNGPSTESIRTYPSWVSKTPMSLVNLLRILPDGF